MLVLSRRSQERIVVDEAIEIVVLRVEGERVVLGIDAPRSVPIRRSELPARPVMECVAGDRLLA